MTTEEIRALLQDPKYMKNPKLPYIGQKFVEAGTKPVSWLDKVKK